MSDKLTATITFHVSDDTKLKAGAIANNIHQTDLSNYVRMLMEKDIEAHSVKASLYAEIFGLPQKREMT